MDKRDGKIGRSTMVVPPIQQMSQIDQPLLSPAGYPAQPDYGLLPPPSPAAYGLPLMVYNQPSLPPYGYPPAGTKPPPGNLGKFLISKCKV